MTFKTLSKSYLPKILFVVLLGASILTVEFFLYRKGKVSSSDKSILIVGGSIAHNFEKGILSFLRSKGQSRDNILTYSSPLLKSEIALKKIPHLIKSYQPFVIYLLMGVDELHPYWELSEEDINRRMELHRISYEKGQEEFTDQFIIYLREGFAKRDARLIYDLGFLHEHNLGDKAEILNKQKVMVYIHDELSRISYPISPQHSASLVALIAIANNFRLDTSGILGVNRKEIRAFPGRKREFRKIFLQNFKRLLASARSIEADGPQKFMSEGTPAEFLDRAWLVATVPHPIPETEALFNHYVKRPMDLFPYVGIFNQFRSIPGHDPDPDQLAMKRLIDDKWMGQEKFFLKENAPPSYHENVSKIKLICERNGVTLKLLQYPGSNMAYITEAGSKLGIQVIDGEDFLKGKLNEKNWFDFFTDKILKTGHLTILGSRLFGESIVKQSKDIFPEAGN